ncbi:LCP family protein [Adlercreutzia sp. ZJ304]|uniref:LCP family protein n=1 Tax=Adlercreutzia sp. ZJ304 TaxID=2709791 RepID=UPI0013ED64AE|nr:LCP family protein [Adlercreutzia sp. ZJ304]
MTSSLNSDKNKRNPFKRAEIHVPRGGQEVAGATGASGAAETMQEEVLIRRRRKHHKRRNRRIRIAVIVAVALVLIIGGVAFAYNALIAAGENNLVQEAQDINTEGVSYDEGKTVTYNGHTYQLKENMTSVCLIGYDSTEAREAKGQVGQADTIMVLAMDTSTGETSIIAIPRDSMVDVAEYLSGSYSGMDQMQICLAFSYGNSKEEGCELTTKAAARVLYNMPINYYMALDMSGVGALSDAIGGVSIVPSASIPNTKIAEGKPIVLFGENALAYVRWRSHSNVDASLQRQERQIQFAQAFASQVITAAKGDAGLIVQLYNTLSEYSITNLGLSEFTYLANCVLNNGVSAVDFKSLSGTMKQGDTYAEFYLDKDSVYQTVLDVYYTQVD